MPRLVEADELRLAVDDDLPAEQNGAIDGALGWRNHGEIIVKLSAAISAASVLSVGMTLVDFAMVGHLGRSELGAAALATTWFNLVRSVVHCAAIQRALEHEYTDLLR
jgi:Na+-driven multidrug efflux pump